MKKSASLEQTGIRQTRASGAGKGTSTAARSEGVKLSPPRKEQPIRLLEEHFPDSETHAVSFEYFNPAAREVLVAGSFNDWRPQATPLTKRQGGKWSTELLLKPGPHEYRLVVDGQWQDDPMAARHVANPFGGLNCVIEVKPLTASSGSRP
jgi:1,4-alpha-glucan branching enzyme